MQFDNERPRGLKLHVSEHIASKLHAATIRQDTLFQTVHVLPEPHQHVPFGKCRAEGMFSRRLA